jgi:hypothetical protein
MTLARALLPYAVISAAIVVCSVALVFGAGGVAPAQVYVPPPTPATRSASAATLPTDVRLAYWRQAADAWELWVSDLEGTRRWVIAREPTEGIALTRWRPDGEAVSYMRERQTLIIAPLVGSPIVVPLSAELVAARRIVVGYHWAPDAERIALSLRAGPPGARTTDVWTVDVSNGLWRRVTEMREGLAGPWIDEDEHLIESLSGSIFIAKVGERVEVRPVTGMTAVSPEIGPDGRLYVAGGGSVSLSGTRPYATGGIWSMALDGTDVRRELADEQGEFRLAGRWVDGRWLIDRGGTLDLAGGEEAELPISAGLIAEVVVVHDRAAVALTGSSVLLLDPAVIGSARATPSAGLTLLVGSVREAEAWRPRADVGLLRGSGSTGSAPLATFVKGNTLWRTEGSDTRAVLRAEDDHIIGTPVWSRDGAMVAVPVFAADPSVAASSIVVLDRSGDLVRRFEVAGQPVWSPDGDTLAVDAPRGSDALDLLPLDERASAVRLEGYDPTWTDAGLIVLTHADTAGRVHLIERYVGDQRVTILEESALATDPRLAHVGPADSRLSIHSLSASPDGQLVAFGARRCCGVLSDALVVARASDGAILTVIPAPNGLDGPVRWSPAGHLFARNSGPFPASNAEDLGQTKGVITIIVDARTGAVIARAPGEFAAWGGGGRTWYTARTEGLFANDLDGGEGVLVSPHGVPMQVAPR